MMWQLECSEIFYRSGRRPDLQATAYGVSPYRLAMRCLDMQRVEIVMNDSVLICTSNCSNECKANGVVRCVAPCCGAYGQERDCRHEISACTCTDSGLD
jgi:hypothetical protein